MTNEQTEQTPSLETLERAEAIVKAIEVLNQTADELPRWWQKSPYCTLPATDAYYQGRLVAQLQAVTQELHTFVYIAQGKVSWAGLAVERIESKVVKAS